MSAPVKKRLVAASVVIGTRAVQMREALAIDAEQIDPQLCGGLAAGRVEHMGRQAAGCFT